jgi:hypothetical protein
MSKGLLVDRFVGTHHQTKGERPKASLHSSDYYQTYTPLLPTFKCAGITIPATVIEVYIDLYKTLQDKWHTAVSPQDARERFDKPRWNVNRILATDCAYSRKIHIEKRGGRLTSSYSRNQRDRQNPKTRGLPNDKRLDEQPCQIPPRSMLESTSQAPSSATIPRRPRKA